MGCRADPQGVGLAGGPSCGNGFGARRVEIECGARGRGKSRQRVTALSSAKTDGPHERTLIDDVLDSCSSEKYGNKKPLISKGFHGLLRLGLNQ